MTLNELNIGQSACITAVGGDGALRQHFLDMGVIPGAVVTLQKFAPMGDPMQLELHGYELTLRKDDAAKITIAAPIPDPSFSADAMKASQALSAPMMGKGVITSQKIPHPGYGEPHVGDRKPENTNGKGISSPLPSNGEESGEGSVLLSFALAGNQNCGKTTLFNQLTGANQHVGNFPGVTVDRKSGSIRGYKNTEITDLPGIYSLSPYTAEEVVSREFLLGKGALTIINIVDATNIERNLYLTMQLMELGKPMVLALNMMDEMEGNGGTILVNEMEQMLGIPVVPISASKNQGVNELIEHAIHVAKYQETPAKQDFCDPDDHGGAVHRCLHAIMHLIEDHAQRANIPLRFATAKLVEGDSLVREALALSLNEQQTIEHILKQMEEERGMDRSAAMADMRYSFIEKLCAATVVHPKESREHKRSSTIDRVLTGKYTALPSFFAIMAVIFWLTFDVIGGTMQEWLETAIEAFTDLSEGVMTSWHVDDAVRSLIIDGVYAGVGSVASFVPIIVTLFFFLSMLEDSGYMARVAFVMDRPLRRIGLSGRSIVPLLIGFGCSVPAVMSSRTLPSERDRRLTVMLTPFMSCTAKLPIYAFFCAAFFPDCAALVMCGLYLLGILVGILFALVIKVISNAEHKFSIFHFRFSIFRGEAVPFVMELPNYRMPGFKTTVLLLWEKARDFLQRAFTVIFMATIIIWFLQSFSFHLQLVEDSANSILGQIASFIAPVFEPLGFGDWRIATSLVGGFLAKESVVSTLTVLLNGEALSTLAPSLAGRAGAGLSSGWGLSFLVFCLLYTPCAAAIASIKRELGVRDAISVVVGQCLIAYFVSWCVFNLTCIFL